MGPGGVFERVSATDPLCEVALGQRVEHGTRAQLQRLPVRDVVGERRPRDEERARRVQAAEVEGRDGSAGLSEQTQQTARAKRSEAALEGRAAHRVVHDVHPATVGEIARALAASPSIVLLDEPFAGIDPLSIADIRDLIKQLKSRGIGVLITDHNVRETLDIVDRACIIYDGKVLFAGTPEALVADENVRRLYLGEGFAL